MEVKGHKIIKKFLSIREKNAVVNWVNSLSQDFTPNNVHLKHLISKINGDSYMFDISKTQETGEITDYQSGGRVMQEEVHPIVHKIIDRICEETQIPKKNCFLQAVDMDRGGVIGQHYDASRDGYINHKCNISILAEDYDFFIDGERFLIEEGDLYCFDASLYKHWTETPFTSRRILLSFGFMLPYEDLGWDAEDPRVRMSRRIHRYFQR